MREVINSALKFSTDLVSPNPGTSTLILSEMLEYWPESLSNFNLYVFVHASISFKSESGNVLLRHIRCKAVEIQEP